MSKHKEIESFILKRPVIAQKLCTKLPFYLSDKFSTNTFLYDNLLILAKKEYFKDSFHLNHTGATAYTKMIASEIKPLLK